MGWISRVFDILSRPLIWWVVCAPWESGVRVRLGKTAIPLAPGVHLRIPFLDRIFVQSVRLRMISDTGQTVMTADGKVVTIAVSIQYAIADIRRLYLSVSCPEATLLQRAQGLIARLVAVTPSTDLSSAMIEEKVSAQLPAAEWGLDQVRLWVTSYAFVKTYRLLMNEYRSYSLGSLEDSSGERGVVRRN